MFLTANSCQSIAVLMTWCRMSLSLAFFRAVWTSKFWDWTSSSTVLSHVVLGRPDGLLRSTGGWSVAAIMQLWFSSPAVWARCPKSFWQWDLTTSETGEQQLMSQSVSFIVCLVYVVSLMLAGNFHLQAILLTLLFCVDRDEAEYENKIRRQRDELAELSAERQRLLTMQQHLVKLQESLSAATSAATAQVSIGCGKKVAT